MVLISRKYPLSIELLIVFFIHQSRGFLNISSTVFLILSLLFFLSLSSCLSLSLSLTDHYPFLSFRMGGGDGGKVYTLAQVSEHNSPKDCWLVIGGKVYDVTKFLEDHPGGDEVLLSATGKDATDDFEDVGHSTSARAMMDEFLVGDIDSSTIPTKTQYTPPNQPHYNQDKTSEFIIKLLQFLVPLVILGVAVGIRFYTKSS